MASLEMDGLNEAVEFLKEEARRLPNREYEVGYTANYALFVHENLEAYHPVGQAKFLEQPIRTFNYKGFFKEATRKNATGNEALWLLTLRILRESKKLVPVDTGNLKASGYAKRIR